MAVGKISSSAGGGGRCLISPSWKIAHILGLVGLLSLSFWIETAVGGDEGTPTSNLFRDPEFQSAYLATAIALSGKASLCEHGRFGLKCEYECHGGEGGFCTDEGIVCFLGKCQTRTHGESKLKKIRRYFSGELATLDYLKCTCASQSCICLA
jgi:hypothetical protein